MQVGLKSHIPNPATLGALGFLWGNVNQVPDSTLDFIPTGEAILDVLAEGSLLAGGAQAYALEATPRATGISLLSSGTV